MRVNQEFYCGECQGYFLINLNMSLNHGVEIVCPNPVCKHKHHRYIQDGQIFENGRNGNSPREEIITTMATYSKSPLTEKMKEAHEKSPKSGYCSSRRDGVPVPSPMYDRWLEVAARERGL